MFAQDAHLPVYISTYLSQELWIISVVHCLPKNYQKIKESQSN